MSLPDARDIPIPTGYFKRVGDALSQLGNVVLLNGDPNESISGRSYRQGWCFQYLVNWALCRDRIGPVGHCQLADLRDEHRAIQLLERRGYTVTRG